MKEFFKTIAVWSAQSNLKSVVVGALFIIMFAIPTIGLIFGGIYLIPETNSEIWRIIYSIGIFGLFLTAYIRFTKWINNI